jgi:hypothetical protein
MATVIDKLVVELGLDPTKFTQGQQQALAQFKRTQEETKKRATDIEEATTRMLNGLNKLKAEAIGIVALVFGATGIKDFIAGQVQADAAVSRTARSLGLSTQALAAWNNLGKAVGLSGEALAGAFQGINERVQQMLFTGGPQLISLTNALAVQSGRTVDVTKAMRGDIVGFVQQAIEALVALQAKGTQGAQQATFLAGQLGIPYQLISSRIAALLPEMDKLTKFTDAQGGSAETLQGKWAKTTTAADSLGRSIRTDLDPALGGLTDKLTRWLEFLQKDWGTSLTRRFINWLGGKFTGEAAPGESGGEPVIGAPPIAPRKPDIGRESPAVSSLEGLLSSRVPGIRQFTSADDLYHRLTGGGAHARGQALDLTVRGQGLEARARSVEVTKEIETLLREQGIRARVLNEYVNPSARATAPHIHIDFGAEGAAALIARGGGAPAAAVASHVNNSRTSRSTTEVHIGAVNVQPPPGSDARSFAGEFVSSVNSYLHQHGQAAMSESGAQ